MPEREKKAVVSTIILVFRLWFGVLVPWYVWHPMNSFVIVSIDCRQLRQE